MPRDRLLDEPRIASRILITGAVVHFLLCVPLYGRRGFPEVDPFWLAMIWLWAPAIPLSAVYEKWSRKRACKLLYYALVTGFTVSWGTIDSRPSNKDPLRALLGLTFYGPMMVIATSLVETISRFMLAGLRKFPAHPYCEKCGYWLRGLTLPRCPECGTEFLAEQLDESYHPTATPFRQRWTTRLYVFLLLAIIAFPFVYRTHAFRSSAASGAEQAELDWKAGTVRWFVTEEEHKAMTPEQQAEVFFGIKGTNTSAPSFEIRKMWRDWEHHTWGTAYRAVIERKLREAGRPPFTLPTSTAPSRYTTTATSG